MATKKIRRITDIGNIIQAIFADLAGCIRVTEGGIDLTPIGALDSEVRVGPNQPLLVYNKDSSTHFVTFGAQGVAAPTDETDGIPILGGEKYMLNSGNNIWVIADSDQVFGYKGDTEPV